MTKNFLKRNNAKVENEMMLKMRANNYQEKRNGLFVSQEMAQEKTLVEGICNGSQKALQ